MVFFKKRNFKKKAKKYFRKRKRYAKKRMYKIAKRLPIGISHTYHCKLRFCEDFSFNVAIASYAEQIFRANSLYDCDYTGIGHQPRYFDQLMAMYSKAYVVASSFKCRPSNAGTTNLVPCDVSVYCHEDPAYASSLTLYRDAVETKYRRAGPIMVGAQPNVGNHNNHWLSGYVNIRKHFNLSEVVGDVHYACSAAGNPDREVFWQVLMRNIYGNDPGPIRLECRLTYYVVFTDPIFVSNS